MNTINTAKKIIQWGIGRLGYQIVRGYRIGRNRDWLMHLLYFKEMYDLITGIEGNIVECGVGYGDSLLKLCGLAYYENKGRRIYGFDSFEGFPKPSAEDRSPRNIRKGEWKVSTVESVYQVLVNGIEGDFVQESVTLVKGFFDESLEQYRGGKVALLHLDVDLYQSYKVTLEYFWPKVAQGGVVLFDEYKNTIGMFPGANKAIDEFLGDRVSQIQHNARVDRYYILKQ